MRAKLILIAILLPLLFLPTHAQLRTKAFQKAYENLVKKVTPSVAAVLEPNKSHIGYGIAIDSTLLITCLDNVLIRNQSKTEKPYARIILRSFRRDYVQATLLGYDEFNRIALYKFPATFKLKPATLASAPPQVGDLALSVGITRNFLGAGMISAVNRKIHEKYGVNQSPSGGIFKMFGGGKNTFSKSRKLTNVIQHDMKMDIRFLGSPVVNLKGEVLGINVSKFLRGTSYAIPTETLVKNVSAMKSGNILEEPSSGLLGVRIVPVSARDQVDYGIKILDVVPGSAADKGGLKAGDILLTFNGEKLIETDLLIEHVSSKTPGTKVLMSVLRGNRKLSMPLVIGKSR